MPPIGTIKYYKKDPRAKPPIRASDGAVGYDVFALWIFDRFDSTKVVAELPIEVPPDDAVLIGSGIVFALPIGFQCEVRPRSGLASRYNIELSNSPGTIDPDYRGEAGILLRNRGNEPFTIYEGDRIAQLIFTSVELPVFDEVAGIEELSLTKRAEGGFGSTGLTGDGFGTDAYQRCIRELDEYFMQIAIATAQRSTCARGALKGDDGKYLLDEKGRLIGQTRKFGCVFGQGERIIASGFNRPYRNGPLCSKEGCLRDEKGIPSGTQIEICRALHAEQAAINTAAEVGISLKGTTMYQNCEPCVICARQIADLGIEALVVLEDSYPNVNGMEIIRRAGIPIRSIRLD